MNGLGYSPLQIREVFHLEFLRRLSLKLKPEHFVLKGGVNLRFYFQSPRYSEDMDLDVAGVSVEKVRDIVMAVLNMASLSETLLSFGIRSVVPPDIASAKQTETTQRFKIHLILSSGLDLYTKIEFPRRGLHAGIAVESVRPQITRTYRVPPLIVPHYRAEAVFAQKVGALADRKSPQARDIFDLFLLHSQVDNSSGGRALLGTQQTVRRALDNLYSVEYEQFRDSVLAFLSPEYRRSYDSPEVWDEIRLTVSRWIEEPR